MRNCYELCAVLATAAILSILLTAMSPRNKARDTVCMAHLKELRRAAAEYEDEHHGAIVPVKQTVGRRLFFWSEILLNRVRGAQNYYCPADEPDGAAALAAADLLPAVYNRKYISYGMNYYLGDVYPSRKRRDYNVKLIRNPKRVIYFGDSQSGLLRPTRTCWTRDFAPFHNGGSQFVFVDGHTERLDHSNLGLLARPAKFEDWKIDRSRWFNWKNK